MTFHQFSVNFKCRVFCLSADYARARHEPEPPPSDHRVRFGRRDFALLFELLISDFLAFNFRR
jgi:hypothetical protein